MIDQVRLALQMGPTDDAPRIVSEAVHAAVQCGVEAHLRATTLHVLEKSPGSERELIRRMKVVLAEADLDKVAEAKVHKAPQEKVQLVRPIEIEEDISGR
jgi:hypothetical protein